MIKVMAAMSGGVDSSVAAALLLDGGYQVTGGMLRLSDTGEDASRDALQAAGRLGIGLEIFDCRADFMAKVIRPFAESYLSGETPNPCVGCNIGLKFGGLLDRALERGCDMIATGHYVRREESGGRVLLRTAADLSKDQSYVLYGLSQHQLRRALFPLGELTKTQVRAIAEDRGFQNAQREESQDVCFIPDGDYAAYIKRLTGEADRPGDFVDGAGNVLGRHRGIVHYTIGQRRGLELPMGSRVYVVEKNAKTDTVTVGSNDELMRTRLTARRMNYIARETPEYGARVAARIRYNQKTPAAARLFPTEDGGAVVEFDTPQRAVAPGQSVVLYDGEYVYGGGIISG